MKNFITKKYNEAKFERERERERVNTNFTSFSNFNFSKFSNFSAKKGMTLVELLIVIAILGILATALYWGYTGYMERARDNARKSNLHNISLAMTTYLNDNYRVPNPSSKDNETIAINSTTSSTSTTTINNCNKNLESNGGNELTIPPTLDIKNEIWCEGGVVGESVKNEMGTILKQLPKDPKTQTRYKYYTDSKRVFYFILAELEISQKTPKDNILNYTDNNDQERSVYYVTNYDTAYYNFVYGANVVDGSTGTSGGATTTPTPPTTTPTPTQSLADSHNIVFRDGTSTISINANLNNDQRKQEILNQIIANSTNGLGTLSSIDKDIITTGNITNGRIVVRVTFPDNSIKEVNLNVNMTCSDSTKRYDSTSDSCLPLACINQTTSGIVSCSRNPSNNSIIYNCKPNHTFNTTESKCKPNSCTPGNGVATCSYNSNGDRIGTCTNTTNYRYNSSTNACEPIACIPPANSGIATCRYEGSNVIAVTCNTATHHKENNTCISNTRTNSNGDTETYSNGNWRATSCGANRHIENNTCAPNVQTENITHNNDIIGTKTKTWNPSKNNYDTTSVQCNPLKSFQDWNTLECNPYQRTRNIGSGNTAGVITETYNPYTGDYDTTGTCNNSNYRFSENTQTCVDSALDCRDVFIGDQTHTIPNGGSVTDGWIFNADNSRYTYKERVSCTDGRVSSRNTFDINLVTCLNDYTDQAGRCIKENGCTIDGARTTMAEEYMDNNKNIQTSCRIIDCEDGYTLNTDRTACISNTPQDGTLTTQIPELAGKKIFIPNTTVSKKWSTNASYAQPTWNPSTKRYTYPSGRTATDYPAFSYCEERNMRLPTKGELMLLTNYESTNNKNAYSIIDGIESNWYWSSDVYARFSSTAWYVGFSYGGVDWSDKTNFHRVVCLQD